MGGTVPAVILAWSGGLAAAAGTWWRRTTGWRRARAEPRGRAAVRARAARPLPVFAESARAL